MAELAPTQLYQEHAPPRAPWPLELAIRREERRLGEELHYLRDLAAVSPTAFFKFALIAPMAGHRTAASPDALAVARIVATRHEDCGPCLQTAVNGSLTEGADLGVVRAVLAKDVDALPTSLALVYRYTEAVVTASAEANLLSTLTEHALGGRAALADLALAIASARIFPTVKRALGHAVGCRLVRISTQAA